ALSSLLWPLREAAARRLAADAAGRDFLRRQLGSPDVRVRAASLTALIDAGDRQTNLNTLADKDPQVGIRAMAGRALAARGSNPTRFLDAKIAPEMRLAAIASLKETSDVSRLVELFASDDPFLRNAAVYQLGQIPNLLAAINRRTLNDPRQRMG